ncbi:unnamed protein product [Phytophthora fragariaefolia]|uniref:Unnamed protein product n=1 Tax=Phytophthora fragariaefolia TaxID=1490495 RepID=A0A9W6Y039_9STRA|nr:unnamed protein product [Phytophthora fragariaefolia]
MPIVNLRNRIFDAPQPIDREGSITAAPKSLASMPAFQQQTTVDFVAAQSASATQQQLQAVHNGRGFCEQASVKVLETYLAEQVKGKTVDVDANLALLKLYQVYPATANAENVATVLVKGVMALPSTFFTGASTMVPENIREVRHTPSHRLDSAEELLPLIVLLTVIVMVI